MSTTAIRFMDTINPLILVTVWAMGGVFSYVALSDGSLLKAILTLFFFTLLGSLFYGGWGVLSGIYRNGLEQNRLLAEIANIAQITEIKATVAKETE